MNDTTNPAVSLPLLNSVFRNFTRQNSNTNIRTRNENLIRDLSQDLKEHENLVRNFEEISKELILMGFPPNIVLHSFLALKYTSVEEAVDLLSKNNEGIWNHKYIEGEDSVCFICDSVESQHRSIKRLPTNNLGSRLSNLDNQIFEKKFSTNFEKVNKENKEFILKINVNSCQICFLEIDEKENKFNLQCKHQFCKECIIEYLKEEIKNARVLDVKCPSKNCVEKFSESEIKNLVSEDYFYKYKKFLQRTKIKDDNSLVVCPIVDCEGYAKKDALVQNIGLDLINSTPQKSSPVSFSHNQNEIALEIKQTQAIELNRIKYICNNGHNFCSVCNQAWHGDSNCDTDKEIKDFATYSGFIVKKCPQCKVWTEKNEGCNHMTCKICSYNWCWLCELECLPDHYMREGTACYGHQFNHGEDHIDEMPMLLLMNNDSLFVRLFVFYIFTFFFLRTSINSIYRRQNVNNVNNPGGVRNVPPKICTFITLTCVNLCLMLISLIFNGIILITMIVNLSRMTQVRNVCSKIIISFTFLILYFVYFIVGGPVLSVLWFMIANVYVIIRLCLV